MNRICVSARSTTPSSRGSAALRASTAPSPVRTCATRASLPAMMSREMRIDEYLARIREHAPAEANADALGRLHRAHRETFLFENLTIQAGGRIRLPPFPLARKFLYPGRARYCFYHNTPVAAALRAPSISPRPLPHPPRRRRR